MPLSMFRDHQRLWITLFVAAVQGVVLFRLHVAIEGQVWPATDGRWLVAFYAIAVVVPSILHLLAAHLRERTLWLAIATIAAVCFGLAWQFGANVSGAVTSQYWLADETIPSFVATMIVLWLLVVAFLRSRLDHGRWIGSYSQLFSSAWQNKLTIAEALAFTGAFWLLLLLWAGLFKSLGYDLFERLFQDPAFVYPFTAITFGAAMHLVGSTEKLVSVAREQVLGLLKWLAPVAALILLLFTPTLLVQLPRLISEGERAIGAVWLLWLVLVMVLLLNAGYQDGKSEQPYPRWLALALRIATPTMPLVAGVAIYALILRLSEYGATVPRVYGLVAAIVALVYAVGYAIAAFVRGPWLRGIERVNVVTALGLICILFLLCTPLLSPYRLAANSQFARAMQNGQHQESAMAYLKFEAGEYGRRKLARLTKLDGGVRERAIAALAQGVDALEHRWSPRKLTQEEIVAKTTTYPPGRALGESLLRAIRGCEDGANAQERVVVFVDLDDDGVEEAIIVARQTTSVFGRAGEGWRRIGRGTPPPDEGTLARAVADVKAGKVAVIKPRLNDLRLGDALIEMAGGNDIWLADYLRADVGSITCPGSGS